MPTPSAALFGAFDRHNFGDLLFPHILAALLPTRHYRFLGLADRDLRPWGGHRTRAIGARAEPPAALIHVGGEILDCTAWEAAVMLASPAAATAAVDSLDAYPADRDAWAARRLATADGAPYVAGVDRFGETVPRLFNAVGGCGLAQRPPVFVAEVLAKLRGAVHLGVRDGATRAFLAARGIAAELAPDPAVLVAHLFGDVVCCRGAAGEIAAIRRRFPAGYLVFQCSADFGDDATLDALAAALDTWPRRQGIVIFRAGLAPWHDDAETGQRLATRLAGRAVHCLASAHLLDLCALLAAARCYAGSSLHGRIVAAAFAVPAVSLCHPTGGSPKLQAYAHTWFGERPLLAPPAKLAETLAAALDVAKPVLEKEAEIMASAYRDYFAHWRHWLD